MSAKQLNDVAALAADAAVRLCWTQWRSMGSLGSPAGTGRAEGIIDPEALILLSLYFQDRERRLTDMVAWWAEVGSTLTSLHRLRRVAEGFPGGVGMEAFSFFASLAAEAGDRRWRKYASVQIPDWVRSARGPEQPRLIESSALWPRLRAAFGVGAKADTLVFLLGLRGAWASASMISFAIGYSPVAVRQAAGEMALAHLIRETEGRPTEYVAPPQPWAELLELHPDSARTHTTPPSPPWRFWSEISAFLVGVVEWSRRSSGVEAPGPYVIASEARDLIEAHSRSFYFNGISIPPPSAFPGLEMLEGVHEAVRVVAGWMEQAV